MSGTTVFTQDPLGVAPAPRSSELISRIEARTARVSIIGLGSVGLPLALLFCEENVPLTGFDIDVRKVSYLSAGGPTLRALRPPKFKPRAAKASPRLPITAGSAKWTPSLSASPLHSMNIVSRT